MLYSLTLQERREEGRILEERLYLQPRGKIQGGRWMEKMGGWATGAQRAEEKVEEGGVKEVESEWKTRKNRGK